jgi:transcription elongation factor GreA
MANKNAYKTTEKGLKKLLKELKERETKIREKVTNALTEAKNQGDLSENDGYSLALDEQQANEARISELKDKIDSAEIVKTADNCDIEDCKANIGNKVTLQNGQEVTYEIVDEESANPLEGKISHISPIGSALIGKKVGEKIKISTPSGETEYTIQKVE